MVRAADRIIPLSATQPDQSRDSPFYAKPHPYLSSVNLTCTLSVSLTNWEVGFHLGHSDVMDLSRLSSPCSYISPFTPALASVRELGSILAASSPDTRQPWGSHSSKFCVSSFTTMPYTMSSYPSSKSCMMIANRWAQSSGNLQLESHCPGLRMYVALRSKVFTYLA